MKFWRIRKNSGLFWSVIPATVLDDMQMQANAKILYGVLLVSHAARGLLLAE